MRKIKVSAVSYTNTLPFLQGIKSSDIISEIELSVDYPSECARKVIEDEADLGIIPVAGLANLKTYHILGEYCIGTKDYVDSVFIFSHKSIEEIETLKLDKQSRTSNGLARILLKHHWKRNVTLTESDQADAFVLIGDRTFGRKEEFQYVYDLGHFWKELTGLEFAFAVWVSKKELPIAFQTKFNQALACGVSKAKEVIPGLPEISNFDYYKYLHESLDFNLNEEKRQAIQQYLIWYKEL